MLNAKDMQEEKRKVIFVYGTFGTGKSSFAATFPTPGCVFDFDNKPGVYAGLDFDYASYPCAAKSFIDAQNDLNKVEAACKQGKYKTVIADSTTGLELIAMERALALDPKRSPAGGGLWNVHYQLKRTLVEGWMRKFRSLQVDNLILIAHMQAEEDEGTIIGYTPMLGGQLKEIIPGLFPEVYVAFTRQKGGQTEFKIRTVTKGLYKARSELSGRKRILPDEIDNTYEALCQAIKNKKEVVNNGKES